VGIIDYTYVNPVVYIESIGKEFSADILPQKSIVRQVSHESLKDAFFLLQETLSDPYVFVKRNNLNLKLQDERVWLNNNILCTVSIFN
jgi:hypothetical protein